MKKYHPTTKVYKEGAQTLPREYYTSEEIFRKEKEQIFSNSWNCIGRADKIKKAGDFITYSIADESIIVVKDSKGKFNAFFNVCRHRGTRICMNLKGNFGKFIQCDYHGWTYGNDGHLINAPYMQDVKGFNNTEYGLKKVQLAEWEGFLFINISTNSQPFEKAWAPLIGHLARFNLPNLKVGHKVFYNIKANWKLVFQNYNECLHCPTIHPKLATVLPFTSSTDDLFDGPFLGGPMNITPPNKSATMSGRVCGRMVSDNIPKDDFSRAYYYSFMPNMLLSIHPDYVNYYIIHPLTINHTLVESEWLFHPDTVKDPKNNMKDAVDFWDLTNRQDWDIIERGQLGISSRSYTPGPYSPRESIPAAWDREYLKLMR